MKTRARAGLLAASVGFSIGWGFSKSTSAQSKPAMCLSAVVEGEVAAGKSYERMFTPGLTFLLEPIASGWIVRVLPVGEPREQHDYAELATPPYRSMTPLAVSTDFSFRAQDAVGWNPRRFRYAATAADFRAMRALYDPASSGDAQAGSALAEIAARQPEAELKILDAHLVPGENDQTLMAATVASHFEATPHTVESSGASPLGRVTWMRFRMVFDLRPGVKAASGVPIEKKLCTGQPTTQTGTASYFASPEIKK
jgi:hypothetical protein